MSQGFAKAICIIQFSKEEISSIFVKISTLQSRFWPCEREVSLFFPFSFLAKVNDVLQSEQRKEPKEIYLFLDGDAPLPPSPFILPSATFFTPNYFPRERENAVHFSSLITFFFFFFFSLVVTSCCFVASLHIQEATYQDGYIRCSTVETQFRATWIFGFKADGRWSGKLDSSSSPNKCLLAFRWRGRELLRGKVLINRFIFRSQSWKRRNLFKAIGWNENDEKFFFVILLDGYWRIRCYCRTDLDVVTTRTTLWKFNSWS